MFVLHVIMEVRPESSQALEKLYCETFRPAISRQEGFATVRLLRPRDPGEGYVLSIAFDNETLQQRWAACEEHQRLWPQMEGHCARCAVKRYDPV